MRSYRVAALRPSFKKKNSLINNGFDVATRGGRMRKSKTRQSVSSAKSVPPPIMLPCIRRQNQRRDLCHWILDGVPELLYLLHVAGNFLIGLQAS